MKNSSIKVIQDREQAISVMRNANKWMKEKNIPISKWWDLKNLNKDFLLQYAKQEEFYCVLVDSIQAAAAILQINQNSQDWKSVDKNNQKKRCTFIGCA